MKCFGTRTALGLLCLQVLLAGSLAAQDSIYRAVRAPPGRSTQLNVHGNIGPNCVPGPPPPVRVVKPPTSGTLSVRDGKLKSERLRNCQQVDAPVRVVLYQPNAGFIGQDEIVYELTTANGKLETYSFTITVATGGQLLKRPNDGTNL